MDQATGLRELVRQRQANAYRDFRSQMRRGMRIIAVTSGKGGVGKSNFVANISIALAQRGERVVVFDADFGLANIDVLYGITPRWNLGHVLRGEKKFSEILVHGAFGVTLVPATSGMQEMAEMTGAQREELIGELAKLDLQTDYLIIDTASGIGHNVTNLLSLADDVIVVTTPEPTALVDAYAVIKLVANESAAKSIKVVVNQVENNSDAKLVVDELNHITQQFLHRRVDLLGGVEKDVNLLQAVQAQKPLLSFAPNCPASRSFRDLAERLLNENRMRQAPPRTAAGLQAVLSL